MGQERLRPNDPLKDHFLRKLKEFEAIGKEEKDRLMGDLMEYGAAVVGHAETLWDVIRGQVESIADAQEITHEQAVDYLFEPVEGKVTADNIMLRLQAGDLVHPR